MLPVRLTFIAKDNRGPEGEHLRSNQFRPCDSYSLVPTQKGEDNYLTIEVQIKNLVINFTIGSFPIALLRPYLGTSMGINQKESCVNSVLNPLSRSQFVSLQHQNRRGFVVTYTRFA